MKELTLRDDVLRQCLLEPETKPIEEENVTETQDTKQEVSYIRFVTKLFIMIYMTAYYEEIYGFFIQLLRQLIYSPTTERFSFWITAERW